MSESVKHTDRADPAAPPKAVRMVVCDLDGTLLYNTKRISARNQAAIRSLRKQGILFGICSGRSAIALKTMLQVWGIDQDVDFVLGFNGAMYFDPKSGQVEEELALSADAIEAIMKTLKGTPLCMAEYQGDTLYSTKDNPIVRQMARRNRMNFSKVDPDFLLRDSLKFMAVGMPWQISAYLKSKKAESLKDARVFRSGPFLLEFVHPALSKLAGVKKAAHHFGIAEDEIVSFGNDNNDLEMLAGTIGVAMANALPAVQKAAGRVTASNKKDGVALYLERYVLNNNSGWPNEDKSRQFPVGK